MPSYYTSKLYEGEEETLRSFILRCSSMNSDPLPLDKYTDLEYNHSLDRELEKAKQKLKYYTNLKKNDDELAKAYAEAKETIERHKREYKEKKESMKARYIDMKTQLDNLNWPPIFNKAHKFMVRIITESLENDCNIYEEPVPTMEEWIDRKIKRSEWEIEYYQEEIVKNHNKIDKCNSYYHELYDFLDKVAPYEKTNND